MRLVATVVGIGVAVAAAAADARAQSYPPITDRDYGVDLYSGAALGSVRIVGMGGTAVAIAEGSAGTLANPAAAAVRLTTSQGSWDWDWHADALAAVYASDFDNNGVADDQGGGLRATSLETFGLAGMLDGWGVAITGVTTTRRFDGDAGDHLEASVIETKLAVAREFAGQAWTVGGALRVGSFDLDRAGGGTLFSLTGTGLELGGLWRPPMRDVRVGASLSFPVSGANPDVEGCDPTDCAGYILPSRVEVPWHVAAGVAWRFGPTRWNQQLPTEYRDERALVVAADLVITGAVPDGYGLEAFGAQQLQPAGRRPVLGLRVGGEYEWLPGRLRLRAGSYWEPSRFDDVGGRVHGTLGVEVSLFQFHVWRWTYRLRVSATGDVAVRYGNAGLSVGFWH